MENLHTVNGKPLDATATQQAPVTQVGNPTVTATAAAATLHRTQCGDVGNVGSVCPSCGVPLG